MQKLSIIPILKVHHTYTYMYMVWQSICIHIPSLGLELARGLFIGFTFLPERYVVYYVSYISTCTCTCMLYIYMYIHVCIPSRLDFDRGRPISVEHRRQCQLLM